MNFLCNLKYFILKEWAWIRRSGWILIDEFDGEGMLGYSCFDPFFIQIWQNTQTGEQRVVRT